jgi:Flp pilus assembly protein TadD
MSTLPEPANTPPDSETRFVSGAIGRDLGLTTDELRFGLVVARKHMLRGAPLDALRIYTALVICEPMNAEFQIGLANCALQLGENHLALQSASVIAALEPQNPKGCYFSGRACLGLKLYAEADEDLREALALAKEARDSVVHRECEKLLALVKMMPERNAGA